MKTDPPLKSGIISFIVTAIILFILLGCQTYYLYRDEFIKISLSKYAIILILFSSSIIPMIMVISSLSMGIFSGRMYFKQQQPRALFMRYFLICTICIGIIGFCFDSFCVPKLSRSCFNYLYNLRNSRNQSEYLEAIDGQRKLPINENVANSFPAMVNLNKELQIVNDKNESSTIQNNAIGQLNSTGSKNSITSVLDTFTAAKKYGLTTAYITGNDSIKDNEYTKRYIQAIIESYILQCELSSKKIREFTASIVAHVFYPLILIALAINGLLLGYIFRKLPIALVIIVFTLFIAIIPQLINTEIQYLVHNEILQPLSAWSLYLVFLMIPIFILISIERKRRGNMISEQ